MQIRTNNKKFPVILITGGHLTPAIAVIDRIRKIHPKWVIHFAGRKFAMESDRTTSAEYRIINEKNIPFYNVYAGRILRTFSLSGVRSIIKIPLGFIQSLFIIHTVKPSIVVSFGGYIALPIVLWAKIFRCKVITHEQTLRPGLANSIITHFADRILTAFPMDCLQNTKKYECIGLPVRPEILDISNHAPTFIIPTDRPIILITGGSTGAKSMNEILFPAIEMLITQGYTIVHQTGDPSWDRANQLRATLSDEYKARYVIRRYIDVVDWSWILNHTHILIGRSGANTVYECILTHIPSVFIPLPWSAGGEQLANARFLENKQAAIILMQQAAESQSVLEAIGKIENNYHEITKQLHIVSKEFSRYSDVRFVEILEAVLGNAS